VLCCIIWCGHALPWGCCVRPAAVRHVHHFLWSTDGAHKGSIGIEGERQGARDDAIVHHLEVLGEHLQIHLLQEADFCQKAVDGYRRL
jgi:hypothetical protein